MRIQLPEKTFKNLSQYICKKEGFVFWQSQKTFLV